MPARKKIWPKLQLELHEVEAGLLVRQDEEEYIAKKWRLSSKVLHVIETAIENGLCCLIQNRHPQPNNRLPLGSGVEYLSFARRPTEYWVFGLNDNAGPNRNSRSEVDRVLFNKIYRDALIQKSVPFQLEKFRNASNIEVSFSDLNRAIKACLPFVGLLSKQRGRGSLEDGNLRFRDESDIERWLMLNVDERTIGRELSLVGNQVRIDCGIIDILFEDAMSSDLVVMEVKQGRAQPKHVTEQLKRYLSSQSLIAMAKGRALTGCLVAEVLEQPTINAIEASKYPIVGIEFKALPNNKVELIKVAGRWPNTRKFP